MGPLHPYPLRQPARTERKAALALLLGIVSMGFVGPVAGVPAMILGALARRDIDRAGGALTGRGLAAAGIATGLFGTGLGLVLALSILGAAFSPDPSEPESAMAGAPAALARTDDATPVAANTARAPTSSAPHTTISSGPPETFHATRDFDGRCAALARAAGAPSVAEARMRCP